MSLSDAEAMKIANALVKEYCDTVLKGCLQETVHNAVTKGHSTLKLAYDEEECTVHVTVDGVARF